MHSRQKSTAGLSVFWILGQRLWISPAYQFPYGWKGKVFWAPIQFSKARLFRHAIEWMSEKDFQDRFALTATVTSGIFCPGYQAMICRTMPPAWRSLANCERVCGRELCLQVPVGFRDLADLRRNFLTSTMIQRNSTTCMRGEIILHTPQHSVTIAPSSFRSCVLLAIQAFFPKQCCDARLFWREVSGECFILRHKALPRTSPTGRHSLDTTRF